jgi:multimeric flavodoxin WrbA
MVVVLGILGSPRRHGNTAILMEAFLEGARGSGAETILLDAAALDISGCSSCNACQDTGTCVMDDDMAKVYDSIRRADVVVLGTPLYFSGMSSQLKAVIDRCQCLWQNARQGKGLTDKRGYLLCVGAMENANFRNVISEVRSFYKGVGLTYAGEITVAGVESENDILLRTDDLALAHRMGGTAVADRPT